MIELKRARLESKTLKQSDLVLVINSELEKYAIKLGADPEKVKVIPAGIDDTMFNPSLSAEHVRVKYNIARDEVVLFFMGWLYPFSGLKEVALSLLKYNGKLKMKLFVIGRGELYEELANLRKNGLNEKLLLVEWQPYEKVPEFIAASDICLLPAYNSAVMRSIVPIKLYEYLACGKPVVATKLPGVMKEFGDGNGVVYVNGPEDVLDRAIALVGNKQEMKQLGVNVVEYVRKRSWQSISDQFEKTLEESVRMCRLDRTDQLNE